MRLFTQIGGYPQIIHWVVEWLLPQLLAQPSNQ